jgi:hypothetical protein
METVTPLKLNFLGFAIIGLKQTFRMPSVLLSYDGDLYMGFGWKLDLYIWHFNVLFANDYSIL